MQGHASSVPLAALLVPLQVPAVVVGPIINCLRAPVLPAMLPARSALKAAVASVLLAATCKGVDALLVSPAAPPVLIIRPAIHAKMVFTDLPLAAYLALPFVEAAQLLTPALHARPTWC